MRKNPIATRKMMEVLLRGQRYVADPKNKEEVLALFVEQTRQDHALTSAIWDEYAFDPVFDDRYVRDMQRTTDYLVASGRSSRRAIRSITRTPIRWPRPTRHWSRCRDASRSRA